MAERGNPEEKSLEMRLAAIEDKLSRMGASREEMTAHQRASLVGAASTALSPQLCSFCYHCVISIPVSIPVHTHVVAEAAQQSATKQGGTDFEKLGR
jgi:hypothetical protein